MFLAIAGLTAALIYANQNRWSRPSTLAVGLAAAANQALRLAQCFFLYFRKYNLYFGVLSEGWFCMKFLFFLKIFRFFRKKRKIFGTKKMELAKTSKNEGLP